MTELKDFLVSPVKTEKSLKGEKSGKHTFLVRCGVNKDKLKKELEQFYKVKIIKMNTLKDHFSQRYLARYRRTVKGPLLKKVVVTLAEGQLLAEASPMKEPSRKKEVGRR